MSARITVLYGRGRPESYNGRRPATDIAYRGPSIEDALTAVTHLKSLEPYGEDDSLMVVAYDPDQAVQVVLLYEDNLREAF